MDAYCKEIRKLEAHFYRAGAGLRYHSSCLRDSASDPARGLGAATTRRVSAISPATLLGGWMPWLQSWVGPLGQMIGKQQGSMICWVLMQPENSGKQGFCIDPRKASSKPSEARGLHPTGAPRGASRWRLKGVRHHYESQRTSHESTIKIQAQALQHSGA